MLNVCHSCDGAICDPNNNLPYSGKVCRCSQPTYYELKVQSELATIHGFLKGFTEGLSLRLKSIDDNLEILLSRKKK